MANPVIGVSLDLEPAGGYTSKPWYALRKNYSDSLVAAGALTLGLPYQSAVTPVLDLLDGLCLTGGGFDLPAALYGQTQHPLTHLKPERTRFEQALLAEALARDMPVLGICGGQQLIAVHLGATLIQHLPDHPEVRLDHSPSVSDGRSVGDLDAHVVNLVSGSLLHQCCQSTQFWVNSAHHQAVAPQQTDQRLYRVNAWSPDGVIEGIESVQHRFCLGVQWHPEFQKSPEDGRLLQAFVEACRDYSVGKARPCQ